MGSRGAFVNVDTGNFSFVQGGQHYFSIGTLSTNPNVKVLVQPKGSVKAPEFSHTEGRVYAIVQEGRLKHVTYYDEKHNQAVSIDLTIPHDGLLPHKHIYLNHKKGDPISDDEKRLIEQIRKEFNLR